MTILQRFEVLETLSSRNSVKTYKCRDVERGLVVLKVFDSVGQAQMDSIRAHSRSLERLSHPGLQQHYGSIEGIEEEDTIGLAFEWVEGRTLAEEIEAGVRYTDDEIFLAMETILEALEVAHGLNPPLVHRDIKPENVVRTTNGWVLIDFGASREAVLGDGETSVIGTTGYAAPEQFFGQALPSSDQYGLGATILHLATHRHPTDFPIKKLRLDLESSGLSRPLLKITTRMLSPDPHERFADAASAIEAVRSGSGMQDWEFALEPLADAQSVLHVRADGAGVQIEIRPRYNTAYLVLSATLPVVWVGFLAFMMVTKGAPPSIASLGNLGMALMMCTVFLLPVFYRELHGKRTWGLSLNPEGWRLEREGRTVAAGAGSPEILPVRGWLQELDKALDRRAPAKLKDNDRKSPVFGFSLTAKEREVLRDVVASCSRQFRKSLHRRLPENPQALSIPAVEFLQGSFGRPTLMRRLSAMVHSKKELSPTPKRDAYFGALPNAAREMTERNGFKKIGYVRDSIARVLGVNMEAYASSDGAVVLQIYPGVLRNSVSNFTYSFSTMMNDGRIRYTWSHPEPTTQTEGLVYSVGSSGGFERDLQAHRDWIAEQFAERGSLPVRVLTMSDHLAVMNHYNRYIISPSSSRHGLFVVAFLFGMIGFSIFSLFKMITLLVARFS